MAASACGADPRDGAVCSDYVRGSRCRDPAARPTAKQALAHPWLRGKSDERGKGQQLPRTVVQRLQKFGVESALKRTVLDMIANDLINQHMSVSAGRAAAGAAGKWTGSGGRGGHMDRYMS